MANAFCEDPKTKISGYRVPLAEEISGSIAILTGQVVKEERVFEVVEDPEFYYSIFTVRVERQFKGQLPLLVTFRIDYDSGNYRMGLGEKHILFVRKWPWKVEGADFRIDPCGSSSTLPQGNDTVERVVKTLPKRAARPNKSLERTREG